jgi:hypothetical protein
VIVLCLCLYELFDVRTLVTVVCIFFSLHAHDRPLTTLRLTLPVGVSDAEKAYRRAKHEKKQKAAAAAVEAEEKAKTEALERQVAAEKERADAAAVAARAREEEQRRKDESVKKQHGKR